MQKSHKELYSQHEEYDPLLNEKLGLLYQGGFAIQSKASLFLKQLQGIESGQSYQARLSCAAYLPYLSEFITQFSSSLFSENLEVKVPGDADDTSTPGEDQTDDFYKEFIQDCDLNGRSFHQFMQDVFEASMHQIKVYVGLDFPKANQLPNSLIEEEMMGLSKGYAYTIPYCNVIDWKKEQRSGKFIWLKLFEECFPNDDPLLINTHYFQFKFWTVKEGKGCWQLWTSPTMPITKTYNANTIYTMTEEGSVSFPEIPVFDFHVPKGYHVGLQIGALCQEHYQRRSFMVSNANKTCVALGVVKLGPEMSAPGDALPPDLETPEDGMQLRRKLESDGWIVLRKTDKWEDDVEIIEAKGESHKFIAEELKSLVEAMMQTLRQMNMTASANKKAVGRSAASKQIDQHGTSMLLSVYERIVKDFVRRFFICLSAGRKEKIEWTVEGLSIAEPVKERADLITEVMSLKVDIMKMPEMFKNKYLYRLATELLDNDLSDREKSELQEKIAECVEQGDFDAEDLEAIAAAGAGAPQSKQTPDTPPKLGPAGQPLLDDGAHLQTGEHVDSQVVYDQLSKDYQDKDIQFVLHIPWTGPAEVPLSSIDFTNKDNWQASKDVEQVKMFAEKMKNEGFSKPIILVNNPSNDNKMSVIDGHHRLLAAQQNNTPVNAFIGQVGSDHGPWEALHSKQVGSKQASKQMTEQSMQKQVSHQINKSEHVVGKK